MNPYIELMQGFRDACNLSFSYWKDPVRQEHHIAIERNGERLWVRSITSDSLAKAEVATYLNHEQINMANQIVDNILQSIDWNTFYEFNSKESPVTSRLYEGSGFRRHKDPTVELLLGEIDELKDRLSVLENKQTEARLGYPFPRDL